MFLKSLSLFLLARIRAINIESFNMNINESKGVVIFKAGYRGQARY